MTREELRAALSLAAVFSVRLLGLFMIYPVFAAYADGLAGATEVTIGLALGIYGLTQGILQIPFGLMSDRIGRKTIIAVGLLLFAAGSAVAGTATSIEGMIVGRALQGAGAVGSVILALVADLTREEVRTRTMAIVGITIGLSFMVALVAGPILSGLIGVPGIFWLMVALSAVGIAILYAVVPTPRRVVTHRDAQPVPALLGSVLTNGDLLRLDFGVFALHAILTSSFLVVPHLLRETFALPSDRQWLVYLPVMVASVLLMIPAVIAAEKHRRMKPVFLGSIIVIGGTQIAFMFEATHPVAVVAAILAFFAAFNVMEATLPSLITKAAPAGVKGTATGVYSSAQFLGIFIGGAIGGWAHQTAGGPGVFAFAGGLAVAWLAVAATMRRPDHYSTRLARVGEVSPAEADALASRLGRMPGVVDVAVVAEEGVAYLKVDAGTFDQAALDEALKAA